MQAAVWVSMPRTFVTILPFLQAVESLFPDILLRSLRCPSGWTLGISVEQWESYDEALFFHAVHFSALCKARYSLAFHEV